MAEEAQPILRVTKRSRKFQHRDDEGEVSAVIVFPDGRRMVTCSFEESPRLWDLETGVVLKDMVRHRDSVPVVAVSRDGKLIATGDVSGELMVWNRDGESLAQPIGVHSENDHIPQLFSRWRNACEWLSGYHNGVLQHKNMAGAR